MKTQNQDKATVTLAGGRIEINLGLSSIALAGNHENAKLAQEIVIALNEHAALVVAAEAANDLLCHSSRLSELNDTKFKNKGEQFEYNSIQAAYRALANLAAVRGQ